MAPREPASPGHQRRPLGDDAAGGAGGLLLSAKEPQRALRRRAGGEQRELRCEARRGVHLDRAQRRGQDHGVQPDQPHLHAHHRHHRFRRPQRRHAAPDRSATPPDRQPGHRAHLSKHRAVRTRHRVAKPADWPPHPSQNRLAQRALFHRQDPRSRNRGAGKGRRNHRISRPATPPRIAGGRSALWHSQSGGTGPRAVHRAQAAAARRTFVGPERGRNRRHGLLDRRHQKRTRHHRA